VNSLTFELGVMARGIAGVTDESDEHSEVKLLRSAIARIESIGKMQAAFHDYFYFHENFDIREGHRKRCNRWKGLECTCDGDKIRAEAVKYAVTQASGGTVDG
jgi:hypothetical protein